MNVLRVVGRACAVLILAAGAIVCGGGPSPAATTTGAGAPTLAAPAASAAVHSTYFSWNGEMWSHISFAESLRFANANGYAVAVFYDGLGYNNTTGSTLVIVTPEDCTLSSSNKDWRFSHMPNGWNDRVSSVTTQMGNGTHCDVWFSSDINFEGECGNRWIHMQADLRKDGCQNRASSFELT
ncbi:hypothetical protein OG612_40980 [Streptomyces sp. NBC_01527]|uniref:hypothetical protein n=1 Tax=Streptomyces sp. NBC_01527 TaxID=2903894 RepID=UPI00386BDEE3